MKFVSEICVLVAAAAFVSSCAPAPLYTHRPASGAQTLEDIPRDARGEPVWSAIKLPPQCGRMPASMPVLAANAAVTPSDADLRRIAQLDWICPE